MYVTFESDGHTTKTFTKSLVESDFSIYEEIPQQVLTVFSTTGQNGVEIDTAYKGELQYFKQGAYNQTNGKDPEDNMIWNTGAETYNGDLADQYTNGSYTEVWFKEAAVGSGTAPIDPDPVDPDPIDPIDPIINSISDNDAGSFNIYPNPATSSIKITSSFVQIKSLQLLNFAGQSVIIKPYVSGTEIELNLDDIESGNYILIIEDIFKQKTVSKIIKK